LNLSDQIALAKSLFENGEKVQALLKQRDKLSADLAKVDEELATLLPAAPATSGSGRAAQKCSKCGSTEHNSRKCPQGGN
jgi:hypothetical protein